MVHVNLYSTRRCFRWRIADSCGQDHTLKCSLRHRENLHESITTNADLTRATIFSPGFEKQKPKYFNRNFCIYNISLNCPDEMVELVPSELTTEFADTRDYLSFHVNSTRRPFLELNGADVARPSAYTTIPSTSFSTVLWSDHNGKDKGRFEILARCRHQEQREGSGVGTLAPETVIN
jgi:hypothetical protein